MARLTLSLSLVLSAVVIAGLGGTAGAAAGPKAVVTLLPATVAVGQNATVAVSKSVLPKGDSAKKLVLTWGDGSKAVTLASLGARAAHHYVAPGHYTVTVKLTDAHGQTVSGSAIEVVQARSGSYSGSYSGSGYGITLYVSGSQTQVQDISIPVVTLDCTGTTFTPSAPIVLDAVALAANGAMSSTQTQTGVVGSDSYPTTFTITFTGRFQGLSPSGAPLAAGSVLETARYTDGTTYSCTSNKQSWSVSRDAQPTQSTALPPAGSYSGNYSGSGYG
ncbi:MAG: PKD domain-containing protein, partial [Acidimicrobiales bacterium]